jgi:hypothetical protein
MLNRIKEYLKNLMAVIGWLFQQSGFVTAVILVSVITVNRVLQENGFPGYVESTINLINFIKGIFNA